MAKWECPCGFVYIEGETPPGVKFEELPDDWVCPICGAAKEILYKLEEKE